MSMYNQYEEHCEHEPSEFDEAVDGFKELLRKQVAQEVKDELTALRKSNAEMAEQLKELPKLLREASKAKVEYEAAQRTAEHDARQKGINDLLSIMAKPKFRVKHSWLKGPKCDKCDDDRRIRYITPLGKDGYEYCDCNTSDPHYNVVETMAHTLKKGRNGLTVWYAVSNDYLISPEDSNDYIHTSVLYEPMSLEEMTKGESQIYGFEDRESAQELADALNARD